MRVLLVEDEKPLATAVAKIFENNHILTDVVHDGEEGRILAEENVYDVIILDIMLPGVNGLEILQGIRDKGKNTPVLLLTAMDTTKDKVKGLNMGADDYMVKPFESEELLARVRALGRRPQEIFHDSSIGFCDIRLNINTGEAMVADVPKSLTAKEAQLLEMFLRNPNRIVSKELILDRIWGFDSQAAENSVEIYVHYLRKKMAKSGAMIQTVRGMGYVLKERE